LRTNVQYTVLDLGFSALGYGPTLGAPNPSA